MEVEHDSEEGYFTDMDKDKVSKASVQKRRKPPTPPNSNKKYLLTFKKWDLYGNDKSWLQTDRNWRDSE